MKWIIDFNFLFFFYLPKIETYSEILEAQSSLNISDKNATYMERDRIFVETQN